MSERKNRQFKVFDPRPGDGEPVMMSEDEVRQTYGYLIDVIDLDGFRQVSVEANGSRIEVNEVFDAPGQHMLPQ